MISNALCGIYRVAELRYGVLSKAHAIQLSVQSAKQKKYEGAKSFLRLKPADRDIEIVADRGIHAKLGSETREAICREMEAAFCERNFEAGVLAGILTVSEHLAHHFPVCSGKRNEMADSPVML